MSAVVGVVSAKGGVGKTTVTSNLAAALARRGHTITAVDGNITTPNLSIHLGCALYPVTLHDVLIGRAEIREALYRHSAGFRVVPASLSVDDVTAVNPEQLNTVVRSIPERRGLILLDAAAGLGREARAVMDCADSLLIVTNPDLPAVTDALKAVRLAQRQNKPILGVVINRARVHSSEIPAAEVTDMLDVPVLAIIPEDRAVPASIAARTPVVLWKPRSRAAVAFRSLAATMCGEKEPEAGFLSDLLGWLRG